MNIRGSQRAWNTLNLPGMIILAIETAKDACSVAVDGRGGVSASMTLLRGRSHGERLVPMIVETLRRVGVHFSEIDAVAVSAGPGSYTGLRIGVSTAKGICLAHGAKIIGVPTLAAYARAVRHSAALDGWSPATVSIALASRRDEVYFGMFDGSTLAGIGETRILSASDAARCVENPDVPGPGAIGGDAAENLLRHLRSPEGTTLVHFFPAASHVAAIGRAAIGRGEQDDLNSFEPYYLKEYLAGRPSQTVFDRLTS